MGMQRSSFKGMQRSSSKDVHRSGLKGVRSNRRVRSAVKATVETLERRQLLTTFSGGGVNPNTGAAIVDTFEFESASGVVRVAMGGNITAEFLALEIHPGDDDLAIPVGQRTLIDLPAVDAEIGADIFKIYISAGDESGFISIAEVAATGIARPMQPFSTSQTIRFNNFEPGSTAETLTITNAGGAVIGAFDIADSAYPAAVQPSADRPILTYGDQQGDFPVPGIGVMPAPTNGVLIAGVESAPGVTVGKVLIGGITTGVVSLGGSIDTFYTGALLTGDAFGLAGQGQVATFNDNFSVNGDIRNLIVGSSIGTDDLDDDDVRGGNFGYNTGVDINVTGRIGQIVTFEDFYGSARAQASRPATELTTHIKEVEFRIAPLTGSDTLFQRGFIGAATMAGQLVNDTFATPQYLYTYFDSGLNEGDVAVIDGTINAAVNVDDFNDYYGLPLLAGQTVTVDLDTNGPLNVGVFDPDNRLIASDYSHAQGNSRVNNLNQPFQFTAEKAGVYRLAVGGFGDQLFDGPTLTQRGVVLGRPAGNYTLTVRGAADINFGAVDSRGSILTDQDASLRPVDSFTVLDGDLGVISASETIAHSLLTGRYYVASGNLRAITAESIGYVVGGGIGSAPDLHVRKGTVGLLKATGTEGSDVLAINLFDADPSTGSVDRTQAVGVDYQVVEAAGTLLGNFITKRAIGVVRAGNMSTLTASYFVANSDASGSDGVIGLIDVAGDFGTIGAGGPAIDTGSGGNVRYINVGGTVFRDTFFGSSGSGETVTVPANQAVTLTDDSGTDFTVEPVAITPNTGGFGQPSGGTVNRVGQIQYTPYAIRSTSGGRSGVALVNLTSSTGMKITSFPRGGNAVVDIAQITVNGTGRPIAASGLALAGGPNDLTLDVTGAAPVNVFDINGGLFSTISNASGGEIVNVNATSIGNLTGQTIGLTPKLLGVALNQIAQQIPTAYPFIDQRVGVNVTGSVINVRSNRGLGNINIGGNVSTIVANADNSGTPAVFEGINEPIQISGNVITRINIGEGVLPTGTGQVARSGIYVGGVITRIENQGLGSDIRGDVVSNTAILTIELDNGAIINNDIAVIADYEDTTELPQVFTVVDIGADTTAQPIFELNTINLNGVGGIIGSYIRAADIGSIRVNGGFGMIASTVQAGGTGVVNAINVDGYGIRSSSFDMGGRGGSVVANGIGKRLDTTAFTASVRQSEGSQFDQFFGTRPNELTDLHAHLGTTASAPKRKGVSNNGLIADSLFTAVGDLGSMQAYQIQARDPFDSQGVTIPFTSNQFPMRMSYGQKIGRITTVSDVIGLSLQSGGLDNFTVRGGAVERSSLAVSGRVNVVDISGTFRGTSRLVVTGSDGALVSMRTGGSLFGQVNVALGVGRLTVGGDFASPSFLVTRNIDLVDITGSILTGGFLRSKRTIVDLQVDGNIQAGSTVQAKAISSQTIGGQVFGNIVITG
ncbi:MAG TPA: hypothetical protein PLD59_04315 [Tepidisphaeraceae bacterium]|nr:hypothetical protein [Tepidisphaeraceae bacterium]